MSGGIDLAQIQEVPPARWRELAHAAVARGEWLEWLFGVDITDAEVADAELTIVVTAIYRSEESTSIVRTYVTPAEPLPSVADMCRAASWYERELAEMFGVTVTDGDPRRLLLHWQGDHVQAPLRRTFALDARVTTPWPGAKASRRSKVPGVNPQWRGSA